jgi:hypothetical protein
MAVEARQLRPFRSIGVMTVAFQQRGGVASWGVPYEACPSSHHGRGTGVPISIGSNRTEAIERHEGALRIDDRKYLSIRQLRMRRYTPSLHGVHNRSHSGSGSASD